MRFREKNGKRDGEKGCGSVSILHGLGSDPRKNSDLNQTFENPGSTIGEQSGSVSESYLNFDLIYLLFLYFGIKVDIIDISIKLRSGLKLTIFIII